MAEIEYFYSSHSGYAYIGSAKFMQIAAAGGHTVIHRPMDLRAVVAVTGPGPTNSLTPQRRAYFSGREIERWAEARGVGILARPTHHDNGIALSNGMLIAGLQQGVDIGPLAHRMLEGHWRDDADLDDRETLAALGKEAGIDPAPLLDAALSPEIQAIYDANTQEAIERSVFGSPTYFVGGDMFYGQDHLELVERALVKPFSGTWPR
ncbi:MAG: 2-hydroxychromene-2-carboxylate isomerase [Rhodospirillaceae bacterium]|nr:2-hydroxychromene-2-carboxylate isomerase [Rhodospirillaceae bacterium]MDD9913980.1 2-hydroxychromene-2-carboxylate isomerase [Rhodospirillaceae bacterium]